MQFDHAKSIKGLSIAVIVLAALGIIGSLVAMGMMNIIFGAIGDYGYSGSSFDHMHNGYMYDDYYFDYYYDDLDPAALMLVAALSNGLFVWAIVCAVVTLIAGIIGLRYASTPEKLGLVFGWAIVGAVIGFIGMGIIVCVLEVIVAVFANKDKQLYKAGAYGQPVSNQAPYVTAAPETTQPVFNQQPAPTAAQTPSTQTPADQVPAQTNVPTETVSEETTITITEDTNKQA